VNDSDDLKDAAEAAETAREKAAEAAEAAEEAREAIEKSLPSSIPDVDEPAVGGTDLSGGNGADSGGPK